MSYEVRFKTPTQAIAHAMSYNGRGVRLVLSEARKSETLWELATFQFAFAFAGIQGYPVTVFHGLMVKKGLAK